MRKATKAIFLAMIAIGLLGSWFAALSLLRMGSTWSDHVHGRHVESGPRILPKEKLTTLSKENLAELVRIGEMALGAEYSVSRSGYDYLVVISAVESISTVVLTFAFLWGTVLWRKARRRGTETPASRG